MSQQTVDAFAVPSSRRRAVNSRIHIVDGSERVEQEYSDLYMADSARNSRENHMRLDEQGSRGRRRVESPGRVRYDKECIQSGRNSPRAISPVLKSAGEGDAHDEQEMFCCNICYEMASEPVVTLCGHLYCWPCLYRWLQMRNNLRTCPVCKAGVDRDKVIPVYGRGGNGDPRLKKMDEVPLRPSGQRPAPVDARGMYMGGGPGQGMQLPQLFGFTPNAGRYGGYISPEQHHQAFLSRLLLMLGSFVIMCLLLF